MFISGVTHKLQMLTDSKENTVTESNSKISSLTKERDELLELVMQRGKLITVYIYLFTSALNTFSSTVKSPSEIL